MRLYEKKPTYSELAANYAQSTGEFLYLHRRLFIIGTAFLAGIYHYRKELLQGIRQPAETIKKVSAEFSLQSGIANFVQFMGDAAAQGMEKISEDNKAAIQKNSTLYPPIINTLITFTLSTTSGILANWLMQSDYSAKEKEATLEVAIHFHYEKSMEFLKSSSESGYYDAALNLREARILLMKLMKLKENTPSMRAKLSDIYYNEALALFSMGKYRDPIKKLALETLNELITIEPENRMALNLRGMVYLQLYKREKSEEDRGKAKENFARSILLDDTQNDIHLLFHFCNREYEKVIQCTFSQLKKYSDLTAHSSYILARCWAEAFEELSKKDGYDSHTKLNLLRKAISFYEAAEDFIPKNPVYAEERKQILEKCVRVLIKLGTIIDALGTRAPPKILVPIRNLHEYSRLFLFANAPRPPAAEGAQIESELDRRQNLNTQQLGRLAIKYWARLSRPRLSAPPQNLADLGHAINAMKARGDELILRR